MASRPGQQGGSRERNQHPAPSHSSLVGSGGGTSGISSTTHPTHSSSVIQNQGRQLFFIFCFSLQIISTFTLIGFSEFTCQKQVFWYLWPNKTAKPSIIFNTFIQIV